MLEMEELVERLISGSHEEFSETIVIFLDRCKDRTRFSELDKDDLRRKLWNALHDKLNNPSYISIHHHCLAALRMLSRDKTDLNELVTNEIIDIALKNSGLAKICEEWQASTRSDITIESLKLLCNLLFNNTNVQKSTAMKEALPFLIERLGQYDESTAYDIKLFDMRILFLITALNVPMRTILRFEYNGDVYLIRLLKKFSEQLQIEDTVLSKDNTVILACEVLKVLFNLYIQSDDMEGEKQEKNQELVKILHDLLVAENLKTQDELQSNIVNLLTVVPYNSYSLMIQPLGSNNCKHKYENNDLTAVAILLKFLDRKLNVKADLIENISPIVTALLRLVKTERIIRKYVRLQVLPPLKDVMKRPEEGTTLRAKLCKLLTIPLVELRDLVAEFLFVLCKENVSRMVKYTGYGNAAGMFANKGLLGRNLPKTAYSSESEDSETEEYSKYKDSINPVTGCFEPSKPNPLEGMSEEQKEYEAMQLVDLVDKLTRKGVVQPCRIGKDGKPKPIEHVLELQEELPKQQYRRNSDSD